MKRTSLFTGLALAAALMSSTAYAQTELSMWYHGAGNPEESSVLNMAIDDFNAAQKDWKVVIQSFPENAYNDSVVAGALAGNLPDIIDVDGPIMPNWAWSGYLQPLQLKEEEFAKFLPSTIGRWDGKVYSVGLWDAAVAIITRKSTLAKFDIRTPTLDKPWTLDEFNAILKKLKDSGDFSYPLDLGMTWTGEWYPYAFSPLMQSFGGDIIDRSNYQSADGVLNGDAAVAFGNWWQSLFANKYAPGTSQDPASRDNGLIEGKYAMAWNGNWVGTATLKALGDDTLFLPAPDFGKGPTIGAGSWQFGISATSKHPDGASAFIKHLTQDKYITAFSDTLGLVPTTAEAAASSKLYKKGGDMEVFFGLSKAQALVRPISPGYVVAAKVFEKALADIANGADVVDSLDAAVDEIDADIKKNSGYGH